LSSHVLSEVEAVCDRVGLIRDGRLRRVGTLNDLRAMRIHRVEAVFNGQLTAAELARIPGVTDPRVDDHHLSCAVQGSVAPLLAALSAAGVVELDSHELSLEEVFLGEFDQPPQQSAGG
jgi:ABC-2 type transport system ATP-binding protein